MDDPTWHIQIFQLSSLTAQAAVLDALDALGDDVTAIDAQSCDLGVYLIIESQDASRMRLITELVGRTDRGSRLLHETHGSIESHTVPSPVS